MSTARDDGGPAFPREDYQADDGPGQRGMSLRQYYAGQALAGAIVGATGLGNVPRHQRASQIAGMAEIIFEIADAMIAAERNK